MSTISICSCKLDYLQYVNLPCRYQCSFSFGPGCSSSALLSGSTTWWDYT